MLMVYCYMKGFVKKVNSQVFLVVVVDNKLDVFVSIGMFIGIFVLQFYLVWVDMVIVFIIGLIICKIVWDIFKEFFYLLIDGFDVKYIFDYKKMIEQIVGVSCLKDIKVRYLGSFVYIDVVIEVLFDLNIKESYEIVNEVECKMKEEYVIDYLYVYMEFFQLK